MKIDGNSSVLRTVHLEQAIQENQVTQAGGAKDTQGASFEKNRNDMFVEHLERVQNGNKMDAEVAPAQDAKSKLEILSNLTTERDLEQFKKQTEDLEEEELDVIVTVVEKIKTQLATYCEDFDSGMVEDISSDKLEKLSNLTGNAVHVAQKLSENNLPVTEENVAETMSAMEMSQQTGELTDDAKEYCIKANVELTIENIYMAMHSGAFEGGAGYYADGSGYYAKVADAASMAELMPQIERMLAREGMSSDDKTMAQAQWLVEKQLPLTKENLLKLKELDNLSVAAGDVAEDVVLEHIIDALLEGKRPSQAYVGTGESVLARSQDAVSVIQSATDQQLKAVVASGQEVTIAGLKVAAQTGNVGNASQVGSSTTEETVFQSATTGLVDSDPTLITARRQLEEIRLQMTVEASAVMIRNGISVETESLQHLIEQLKMLEEQYYAQLLTGSRIEASAANISLYREITETTAGIAGAPAETLGIVAFAETKLTIKTIHAEATVLTDKYKQAEQAYETIMTKPRSDMGDSIQKAFRNVDDILEDMGLEINNENQRAVRILGYNSLEITEENIQKMKTADMEVTTMLENMKPKAVLEMIREGYNPLDKTPEQINEKLAEINQQTQADQESFSEFLWNLEHSDSISKEERSTYVGIYRLMHQIEKSDGAVVGALVEQGASMTLRNLMTGIRSRKHKDMDYKIGETDGVEGTKTGGITEQIEEGFSYLGQLAGKICDRMSQSDWQNVMNQEAVMDMSVEAFADYVQEMQASGQDSNGYAKEQLQLLNQACQTEEQVLSQLTSQEQPLTIGNILAAAGMFTERGSMYRKLKDYASNQADESLEENLISSMEQLEESFTSQEAAKEAYTGLMNTASEIVNQGVEGEEITFEQMRSWKLISSQIRLASSLSANEDYHIPVEIAGELTSVHVQFVHNEASRGKVAVSFETVTTGKVAAEFTEREGRLEGYMLSETSQSRELFISMDELLKQQIEEASGLRVGKMDYAHHEKLDLMKFSADIKESDANSSVTSASLYQVAKTVIGFVKTAF